MIALYFVALMAITRVLWVFENGGYSIGGYWMALPPRLVPERFDVVMVLLINSFGSGLSGWAATRFHRSFGIAMLLPHLALVSLAALLLITIILTDSGPGTRVLPRLDLLSILGTLVVSGPVSVVLGGIAGLGRDVHGVGDAVA